MFTALHHLIVIMHMVAPVAITFLVIVLAYLLIMALQWRQDKEQWTKQY